jgi:hypothetical protein
MKQIFIILFLGCSFLVKAQFPTTDFTIDGQTFKVKKLTNTCVVTNSQSPIKSGAVRSNGVSSELCSSYLNGYAGTFYTFDYRKEDFIRFYNILREVFSQYEADLLKLEDIDFYFVMNDKGQILDINYQFDGSASITADQIAYLDKRLRASMFFTLKPGHMCTGTNMIGLNYMFSFSELYSLYGYGRGKDWDYNDRMLRDLILQGYDPRN